MARWVRLGSRRQASGKQGHKAFGPIIAGHGKGVSKAVRHAQSTQSIVDFIVQHKLTEVVLLDHYGEIIISKFVEQISDRIKRLIFWNAFVLNDGESMNDNVRAHNRALFDQMARIVGQYGDDAISDLAGSLYQRWRFGNGEVELSATFAGTVSIQRKVGPEDVLRNHSLAKVACRYLNCTEDIALPHGEWGWHP